MITTSVTKDEQLRTVLREAVERFNHELLEDVARPDQAAVQAAGPQLRAILMGLPLVRLPALLLARYVRSRPCWFILRG